MFALYLWPKGGAKGGRASVAAAAAAATVSTSREDDDDDKQIARKVEPFGASSSQREKERNKQIDRLDGGAR